MKLADKLKWFRKRHGVSWQEIQERTGLPSQTIALTFKQPERRTLRVLIKVAGALNVTLPTLFEPHPPIWNWNEFTHEEIMRMLERKAKEFGITRDELVHAILDQAVNMYRVLCPECDGVFWVEKRRPWSCPYCGATDKTVFEDFIIF